MNRQPRTRSHRRSALDLFAPASGGFASASPKMFAPGLHVGALCSAKDCWLTALILPATCSAAWWPPDRGSDRRMSRSAHVGCRAKNVSERKCPTRKDRKLCAHAAAPPVPKYGQGRRGRDPHARSDIPKPRGLADRPPGPAPRRVPGSVQKSRWWV